MLFYAMWLKCYYYHIPCNIRHNGYKLQKKLCYRTLTKHRKTSNRTSDKRLRNTNNNRKIEGINRQDGKGELHLVQDQNVEVHIARCRSSRKFELSDVGHSAEALVHKCRPTCPGCEKGIHL